MQTRNLIQSQANVIRITSLQKGNVVKIINEGYSEPELLYGVVLDLFNDGTKTFIQMLQYKAGYQEVKSEIKLYAGDKELIIFPAELNEVQEYFNSAIESIKRSIENKEEELAKSKLGLKNALEFTSGEMAKRLTLVSFEEIKEPLQIAQ